jgi:hypothetical protein
MSWCRVVNLEGPVPQYSVRGQYFDLSITERPKPIVKTHAAGWEMIYNTNSCRIHVSPLPSAKVGTWEISPLKCLVIRTKLKRHILRSNRVVWAACRVSIVTLDLWVHLRNQKQSYNENENSPASVKAYFTSQSLVITIIINLVTRHM